MEDTPFDLSEESAQQLDAQDSLKHYRDLFHIPVDQNGKEWVYLAGNSLGLQPKQTKAYINQELEDWARLGVEGHFHAKNPWYPYHELLTAQTAQLVGARSSEVVVMNSLTVNLHLMMASFYRPTPKRFKILIEGGAFPSDQYAVASQAAFHGYDPQEAIVEILPRPHESLLRTGDILAKIREEGASIALILFGNVNYFTGQAFNIPVLTEAAHAEGCKIGFDLAHGVGNIPLALHDAGPDFAVWCSYKYLNGGPGTIAGCFVHERHANSFDLPRLAGWWGQDKNTRFQMSRKFQPTKGAEGWQLSNPPIFQLAALRASMDLFDQATTSALRDKSESLTNYMEFLLENWISDSCQIITPTNPEERGAQLSLRLKKKPKEILQALNSRGIICDYREPDVIRAAPTPLYNRFSDVYHFAKTLAGFLRS